MFKYSVGWFIASRPLKGTENCNLQIQIYHLGKQYRCSTTIYMTRDEYKQICLNPKNKSKRIKDLEKQMTTVHEKANSILESLEAFDFSLFKRHFFSKIELEKVKYTNTLSSAFTVLIQDYQANGKSIGTYKNALNQFIEFSGKNFLLENVTKNWLANFKTWYLDKGYSRTTAGIYQRCLRTVYNYHIDKKNISGNNYPFKDYTIQSTVKAKSALFPDDVKKFWEYTPTHPAQQRAKDYWFLSYLCNGANPADLFTLKLKDIQSDRIVFFRTKTLNTDDKQTPIVVPINIHITDIINRNKYKYSKKPNDFVFPFIPENKNPLRSDKVVIESKKRELNRILKRIGIKLNLSQPLILKNARHSFATKLMMDGNAQYAQSMLGHSSAETTSHYLGSLPTSHLKEISDSLLDFDKNKEKKKHAEVISNEVYIPESEMAVISKNGSLIRPNKKNDK